MAFELIVKPDAEVIFATLSPTTISKSRHSEMNFWIVFGMLCTRSRVIRLTAQIVSGNSPDDDSTISIRH